LQRVSFILNQNINMDAKLIFIYQKIKKNIINFLGLKTWPNPA